MMAIQRPYARGVSAADSFHSNASSRRRQRNGATVTTSAPLPATSAPATSPSNAVAANNIDFHPKLIGYQIVALQTLHYFVLCVLMQFNYLLYGTHISLDRVFTDQYLRIWSRDGWPDVWAVLLTAGTGSILLALIVEKSKKCLDFAVTLFLVHVVLCVLYDKGLPATVDWWIVHLAATLCMILGGEYLCSRKEMQDIPLLQL